MTTKKPQQMNLDQGGAIYVHDSEDDYRLMKKIWWPDEEEAKMDYARGEIDEDELFRRVIAARNDEPIEKEL